MHKLGVIGLGKMGLLHLGILNTMNNVEIVSIADVDKKLLSYVKSLNSAVHLYKNYFEMLEKEEMDAVFICTPTYTHTELSLACIDKGINFFVEKPLSNTLESSERLIARLREKKVVNQVGYACVRFMSTFERAKELLDKGLLGKTAHFRSSMYLTQTFTREKSWKYSKELAGGGVLINLASHLIYALVWFFGELIDVKGCTQKLYSEEVEDFCTAVLKFRNGVIGSLDTSWSVPGYRSPEMNIEIHGEQGSMRITNDFIKLYLNEAAEGLRKGWTTIYKQDLYSGLDFYLGSEEFVKEDLHFIKCVDADKSTLVDCYEGYKVQKVIDEIYSSSDAI